LIAAAVNEPASPAKSLGTAGAPPLRPGVACVEFHLLANAHDDVFCDRP
jgi:hypothetical protein